MLKVNEFERDINSASNSLFPFSVDSNIHYRVNSLEDLEADNYRLLSAIIQHFSTYQVPRLSVLDDYSKGRNTAIFGGDRRKDNTKADYRIAHNFGKLIAQFVAGYTTSVPIKYSLPEDKKLDDLMQDFNKRNDIKTLDNELMFDVAKFGRAYEIQYKTEKKGTCIKQANVFETFVIYDTTIDRRPLAAVRIVENGFNSDVSTQYITSLYTADRIIHFKPSAFKESGLEIDSEEKHLYVGVPIVEYQSNKYRTSWYEDVLPLIDAYDQSASDTSNYMTDVINSLLVISGDFSTSGVSASDMISQIKKYGILGLQSGYDRNGNATNVSANYISPEFDSTASENYKERIRKDIFNISNIPDMSDQNFSGNSSGVAMRYKIFGFEQAIGQTVNSFKRSLADRYELLFNLNNSLSNSKSDHDNVQAEFTPNLPYAVSEEVDMLNSVGVPVSRKTMYNQVHFTTADVEEKNLEEEAEKDEANNVDSVFKNNSSVITPDEDKNASDDETEVKDDDVNEQ